MAGTALRTSRQSRINWWRATLQRQREANLSVTEFCRRVGVAVSTFYYWKHRVHEVPPNAHVPVRDEHPSRQATTAVGTTVAKFVPVSILKPAAVTEIEIELTNACLVQLKGPIDPLLLQAAITAAGQLDGFHQGAN